MGIIRNALRPIVTPVLAPARVSNGELAPVEIGRLTPLNMGAWLVQRGAHDALFSMGYLACELAKMRPVSMLPVHVYRSTDGGREEDRSPVAFALSNLVRTRWNPFLSANNAIRWVMLTKDTLGSAYVRVEWDTRQGMRVPVGLWPMTGQVSKLYDDVNRNIVYEYSGDDFTPQGRYVDSEVVEFRSPLPAMSGTEGRSIAEACAAAIGLDIDLYDLYQRLITNGTHSPRWLETDAHLSPRDRAELAASIAGTAGLEGAGVMRVFDNGVKVRQYEASMTDLSYIDESRWILQTICRMTGVPPNEVYDNSQLTYSGNVEMSAIQFSQKTLTPECHELEMALDGILRSQGLFETHVRFDVNGLLRGQYESRIELERAFDSILRAGGRDLYETHVRFDVNGLLRGQYESRMKGYQIGIFTGFFTVDEVREWEELPKVPGGDVRMWPTNYYQVGDDGALVPPPSQPTGAEPPGGTGEAGNMPSAPDKALAEDAFHQSMLARVRERFAETGNTVKFRDFAARVLAPWAHFCQAAGIEYDMADDLREVIYGD